MHYVSIKLSASKFKIVKLGHNGIICHPTSTALEKPCDSQKLPEVTT